jgi:hypothetical protein
MSTLRDTPTWQRFAIAAKDLEKMKLLIRSGADPELTDVFNATALRHAVQWDFSAGVRYLLALGVDRGFHPKYPLTKVNYNYSFPESTIPKELKEILSDAEDWMANGDSPLSMLRSRAG